MPESYSDDGPTADSQLCVITMFASDVARAAGAQEVLGYCHISLLPGLLSELSQLLEPPCELIATAGLASLYTELPDIYSPKFQTDHINYLLVPKYTAIPQLYGVPKVHKP